MAEASSHQVAAVERAVSQVANAVRAVEVHVREVGGRVEQLQVHQLSLAQQVAVLAGDFQAFVAADAKQKALHLAETRVVKVRQELQTRYGHYREVRRRATGVLQAMDAALVTHETIQGATEEVMLSTPGYWLAPALVALAAWSRDDRPLAERALDEALRRDEYKTSLFFALVLRRYRREEASAAWVKRYFSKQDPTMLDRECMVVLDAVTNGGFGPAALGLTRAQLMTWVETLQAEPGFSDAQRARWKEALLALQAADGGDYPHLRQHSPDWPRLADRMSRAHLHARVSEFFRAAFDGEIPMSPRLADEVDAILESLVTNFDDEELPLRKQERELQLVIDHDGDRDRASAAFAAEIEAFEANVSFAALLTNAAMRSEQAGASRATQRFAIAMSRGWIVEAYDEILAEGRADVPEVVRIAIDDWSTTSADGRDEDVLLAQQKQVYDQRAAAARDAVKLSGGARLALGLGGVAAVMGLISLAPVLILAGLGAVAWGYLEYRRLGGRQEEAEAAVRKAHETAARLLRACLAELVDWRAEWTAADGQGESTRAELKAISPQQHTQTHRTDGRGVMTS